MICQIDDCEWRDVLELVIFLVPVVLLFLDDGDTLGFLTLTTRIKSSLFILLNPLQSELLEIYRLQWVRINIYSWAALFLVKVYYIFVF